MNHDLRRFCGVGTGVSMSAGIMGDVGSDCSASSACFCVKESGPLTTSESESKSRESNDGVRVRASSMDRARRWVMSCIGNSVGIFFSSAMGVFRRSANVCAAFEVYDEEGMSSVGEFRGKVVSGEEVVGVQVVDVQMLDLKARLPSTS